MENLSGCREVLGFSFLLFLALRMAIELVRLLWYDIEANNDAFIEFYCIFLLRKYGTGFVTVVFA